MVHPISSRASIRRTVSSVSSKILPAFALGLATRVLGQFSHHEDGRRAWTQRLLPGFIQARTLSDIAPKSAIEWLLAVDVVELSWGIRS
jgi:hypothetical protein